ncbi:hypothetical protein PRIPAC_91973 [Pristionchus pacificus]|uniref:Uncharacterized protein n=1 Tax=Pristionchus pacificus TaxID=54126 RepID=A0A2A6CDT6_PRIPA|nr:hypothetical protein PRIPAC_91973 [Pristionchus pacificus]|eukprot:PDM76382.1 hypothetical protein PRIPAC_39986 [Pristionchus pacificus]
MNTSLRYGWDVDLMHMNYFFGFQWIIEALVLLFLHSTILLILMSQRTVMMEDIRRGYLIDQIGMIL